VTWKRRLARLEARAGTHPREDHCPNCQGTDLIEPGPAELQTIEAWSASEVQRAYADLCRRARLDWCQGCRRLVVVGEQDPSWREDFWNDRESPGLWRNMADLQFLRAVRSSLCAPGRGGDRLNRGEHHQREAMA